KHRLLVDKHQSCRVLNIEFLLQPQQGIYPSIKELAQENKDLHTLLQLQEPFLMLKDSDGLYYTLTSLVQHLSERHKENNNIIIQTLISHVLLLSARMAASTKERTPLQTDIYIKNVIEYIHHNYDRDLKVAELASIVYLHPSYLHRIFKESMNCTIMEYIKESRMDKAKMLLAKTDIPITEISDYVGMNSRQYFSYLFKKTTGQTPRSYRKNLQKIQKFS